MTQDISSRAAMTTRSCTDKVDCLRVTISSDFTRIRRIDQHAKTTLGGILCEY